MFCTVSGCAGGRRTEWLAAGWWRRGGLGAEGVAAERTLRAAGIVSLWERSWLQTEE